MTRHARRVGVAALLGALLTPAGCGGSTRSDVPAPAPTVGQQLVATLPAATMNAQFVTSAGNAVSLRGLSGKIIVLSDVMTLCQETCPLDTANVVAAARAVEAAGLGNRVVFLSITIDPLRDTAQRLRAYRALYSPAPPDWVLATGTAPTVTSFWDALGVTIERVPDTPPAPRDWLTGKPLRYDLTHSDELFFFDRAGSERFVLEGPPHVAPGAPIPDTLRRFLDANGRDNLAHPDPTAWTEAGELSVLSWLLNRRLSPSRQ